MKIKILFRKLVGSKVKPLNLSNFIIAFFYASYIYFLASIFLIVIFYTVSDPSNLIIRSIEAFKLIHESIFKEISPFSYFIFFGFMIEAIIKFSAVKKSWDLENKEILLPAYKKYSTIIGVAGALIAIGRYFIFYYEK